MMVNISIVTTKRAILPISRGVGKFAGLSHIGEILLRLWSFSKSHRHPGHCWPVVPRLSQLAINFPITFWIPWYTSPSGPLKHWDSPGIYNGRVAQVNPEWINSLLDMVYRQTEIKRGSLHHGRTRNTSSKRQARGKGQNHWRYYLDQGWLIFWTWFMHCWSSFNELI